MNFNKVRRQYDAVASRYEALFSERQSAKIRRLRQYLPVTLPSPCLDLGAGTGLVSKVLKHPCIALDISAGMLAKSPGFRVCASMTHLPFANEIFPMVLSVSALTTEQNFEGILTEAIRVLKNDGILALSVLKTEDIGGIERYLRHHPRILTCDRASNGPDMLLLARKGATRL